MNQLQENKLPEHVAIIMDGNGRWAQDKNLDRSHGHMEGLKRAEEIVDEANRLGIKVVTLYTFSTENWNRPETEINMLMNLLTSVLQKKIDKLKKDGVRFQMIGGHDRLAKSVSETLMNVATETKESTRLTLNLAVNYGSRTEILEAIRKIATEVKDGKISEDDITEELMSEHLYTKGLPDPDLLIRTSGEQRISNFLLWQLSYAEFYFTEKFWPEFTIEEFHKALFEYQKRDRRYGHLAEQELA